MAQYNVSNGSFRQGQTWVSWAEYVSGSSGAMYAKGKFRGAGDTGYSSTFTFKDSSNANIQVADGGMSNVQIAYDGQERFTWTPTIYGESSISVWYSCDDMRTWFRLI